MCNALNIKDASAAPAIYEDLQIIILLLLLHLFLIMSLKCRIVSCSVMCSMSVIGNIIASYAMFMFFL